MNIAAGMKGEEEGMERDENLINVEELRMKTGEGMFWNWNQLENTEAQAARTQTPEIFTK